MADTPARTARPAPEVRAAIDIGTNSFHLVVARVDGRGGFELLTREKEAVRLGHGAGEMDELAADEDPLEDEFRAELAGDGDAPAVAEDVVITVEVNRDVAAEMPAEAGDEPDDADA